VPRAARAVDSSAVLVSGPVRTCVGCRERAPKTTLLRVVVVDGQLVVDPAGRLPGRGAYVHPDPRCVDLAEKRRALPRALRVPGPLDHGPLREHLTGGPAAGQPVPSREQVEKRT
jgi:predicted RNA-binding protein YlxR (DUF448 family)